MVSKQYFQIIIDMELSGQMIKRAIFVNAQDIF